MSIALYTLDVGHGLCQIILLPGRRAIVIDGGDVFALPTVSEFLYYHVDTIVAYVATHNDRDHVGAAIHFLNLEKYRTSAGLKAIFLAIDRGSYSAIKILDYALQRRNDHTIERFGCGFLDDNEPPEPKEVYASAKESVRLDLLYPRFEHLIPAIRVESRNSLLQNRSSALLKLQVGTVTVLITGDIDLIGFTRIHRQYRFDLKANVLSVPHHGGHIPGDAESCSWAEIVSIVAPRTALVSCGYRNRVETTTLDKATFEPLVKRGIEIHCTAMSEHCDTNYRRYYPGLMSVGGITTCAKIHQLSGRPEFPEAVACMGTIITTFDGGNLDVIPIPIQTCASPPVYPSGKQAIFWKMDAQL